MTIELNHVPRTTTRKQWRELHAILRKYGDMEQRTDELAAREQLADELRAATVDGQIAIVVSGMDCDCVQYTNSRVVECKGVAWFNAMANDNYEWADGPMHVGFCKPEDRPDNHSRDLAMEAYEDGHPHSISAATI